MRLAFVDIETTGGRATRDRIIEIAIKVIEDGEILNEWQSLIDPETAIPNFIYSLTGITNEHVKGAPIFKSVADEVDELTKDAIFVAHNARFDYAFLKAEFKRLEHRFNRRVLCTVKLAKALYPQFKGHGLDALIKRHDIQNDFWTAWRNFPVLGNSRIDIRLVWVANGNFWKCFGVSV